VESSAFGHCFNKCLFIADTSGQGPPPKRQKVAEKESSALPPLVQPKQSAEDAVAAIQVTLSSHQKSPTLSLSFNVARAFLQRFMVLATSSRGGGVRGYKLHEVSCPAKFIVADEHPKHKRGAALHCHDMDSSSCCLISSVSCFYAQQTGISSNLAVLGREGGGGRRRY